MSIPIAQIRDDFEDNLVGSVWSASFVTGSATYTEAAGRATLTLPSSTVGTHEAAFATAVLYDLTSDGFLINIQTMVATGVAATAYFDLRLDSSNYLRWRQVSNAITARSVASGVDTQLYTATWSSSTYKYLRIRESAGTIFFDSSTNGTSWTNRASVANPFVVTSVAIYLGSSCGNIASPGTFKIEDANPILPALATNWRWTQIVWPQSERFRTVTLALDTAGTAQAYVAFSDSVDVNNDPVSPTYWSGPADSGRVLTSQATQAAAQAMAVNIPVDGRFDLPLIVQGRVIRIYHRSIDGNAYTLREVYPRRLVQADDIEGEVFRGLRFEGHQFICDQLSSLSANIGTVTAGVIDGVTIYAGTSAHEVTLHTNGIVIIPGLASGTGTPNSVSWIDPTTGHVAGDLLAIYDASGVTLDCVAKVWTGAATGKTSDVFVNAGDEDSTVDATIRLHVGKNQAANTAISFQLNTFNEVIISPGAMLIQNGLNLGSATGAGTGQIIASSTITGGLLVGLLADAGTATSPATIVSRHRTSGTAAAGFGSEYLFQADDSTTQDVSQAEIIALWTTATHASRKARALFRVYDSTGAREAMRIEANGSAALIGFLGATAVAQQSIGAAAPAGGTGATAGAYDTAAHRDALITLVNNIRTALNNLGLTV